jgi:hypothetical protein
MEGSVCLLLCWCAKSHPGIRWSICSLISRRCMDCCRFAGCCVKHGVHRMARTELEQVRGLYQHTTVTGL